MGLAERNAAEFGMKYPLPLEGLPRVLRSWSGQGALYQILAASKPSEFVVDHWDEAAVRKRAHRVLFEKLKPLLFKWPKRQSQWRDVLPVITEKKRVSSDKVFRGVDWPLTVKTSGHTQGQFVGRSVQRRDDETTISVLKWTFEGVLETARDAESCWAEATRGVTDQINTIEALLNDAPLNLVSAMAPEAADLASLQSEGHPWSAVAKAGSLFARYDRDLLALATDCLAPDAEMAALLFHIGVFGTFLEALEVCGFKLNSLRPIAGGSYGPVYQAIHPKHGVMDVWFEGGGIWSYPKYGISEPYRSAVTGAGLEYRPLGADILLCAPQRNCLILECKYGPAEYVCRNGYLQAVTYCAELKELSPLVEAMVVGPEGQVNVGSAATSVGRVCILPPSQIKDQVERFFAS